MISDAHPEYREYRAQYQTLQTHDPSQPVDAWGDKGEDEAGLIESTCYDTVSPGNFNPHLVTMIRGSTSMVQPLGHLQHQRNPDATFFRAEKC